MDCYENRCFVNCFSIMPWVVGHRIPLSFWRLIIINITSIYYMEKSVLLGTKPLVDSIRHFIRDPSGVFSVCHLWECRIVQWRHDSRLLPCNKKNITRWLEDMNFIKFISSRHRVISSIYVCLPGDEHTEVFGCAINRYLDISRSGYPKLKITVCWFDNHFFSIY